MDSNVFKSDALKRECERIYNCADSYHIRRFEQLAKEHQSVFGSNDIRFFSSPGRIEIVGNHTDHNGGKVLCAAIDYDTLASVQVRDDGIIQVKSNGYPMLQADTKCVEFCSAELGTSLALIKGVVDFFVRSNKKVGGFSACMTSSVPKGSGVSSSSSFELVIAQILNVLYNDSALDAMFLARASQYAENVFFGKPCGLMDQSAIALGGVNLIDFADFENPKIQKAHWRFDSVDVYVIATGGDHSDLTDDYAAIPQEMKEVANCFGVNLLHEIPLEEWNDKKASVKDKVSDRAFLRAEHFFEENVRVERAMNAVKNVDLTEFLNIVNESGKSSRYKLQNTYSQKGKNRNLENALDCVVGIDGVLASRVHGGGFAGTILVFASKDNQNTEKRLNDAFGKENVFKLSIRDCGATCVNLEC